MTLYIILDLLFFACLCLLIHNVYFYLWPRKENSLLITIFYFLVIMNCTLHIVIMSHLAA